MIDRKYLDAVNPIDDILFRRIRKAGTKTGSKVFGGWSEGHDIDYIMPVDFSPNYGEGIHKNFYCLVSEYDLVNNPPVNGTLSVNAKTENGTIINLILPIDGDAYTIWTAATAAIKTLIEHHPTIAKNMQHKPNRIALFIALKDALK